LTPAPTPADIGGFPRKNMRSKPYPRKSIIVKEQEQSLGMLYLSTQYNHYTAARVESKSKKLY